MRWIQRLCTRLMVYNFTATWRKGSTNAAPDVLSCYPMLKPSQEDMIAECNEDHSSAPSITELRIQQIDDWSESVRLQDIQMHGSQDEEYQ